MLDDLEKQVLNIYESCVGKNEVNQKIIAIVKTFIRKKVSHKKYLIIFLILLINCLKAELNILENLLLFG